MRRFDDGRKLQPLLQDVIVALGGRDGGHLLIAGREDDAPTGEGIERLQQIIVAVAGNVFELIKKPRPRNRFMPQIRNGKFADAEVPVGMSRPLNLKRLAKIKRRLDLLAHQLVENDAIVNAMNRD